MSNGQPPDPNQTAQMKKAGIANIALTIVCNMQPGNAESGGKTVYTKSAAIIEEMLDAWPKDQENTDVLLVPRPGQ